MDDPLAPDAAELLGQATRLYRVVLGRPPDRGGLADNLRHLRSGVPLEDLAAAMLRSPEFTARPGSNEPRRLLARSAGLENAAEPASLPEYAARLVRAARLPTLPTLFPDGLLLRDPAEYRLWLAARAADLPPAPPDPPSLSVLLLPGGAGVPGLLDTVDSALRLPWPGLEVIVALRRFGPALRRRARAEPRLRLRRVLLSAPRAALAAARGTFAVLPVPGDRFNAEPALLAALLRPGTDILLSDEDALDPAGRRQDPLLGDAWDPDRTASAGRPGLPVFRTALLRRVGLRANEPARDLLLRAAGAAAAIAHVPALFLSRPAAPVPVPLRIPHPLPHPPPRASVIIATRDRAELLGACVDGILDRTDYPDTELVVVDNGSTTPDALALLRRLRAHPRVRVLSRPGPFNWAALNNDGARAATGQVLVLLNNDTEVTADRAWLTELVAQASRPGVGAVGARLLYPDGTVQHAGVALGRDGHAIHMWAGSPGDVPGYRGDLRTLREVSAVTGACLALRREVWDRVGGCDAEHLPVTWNDIDLCLRIRAAGLRVLWTPYSTLLHHEQASRGTDDTPENQLRFRREQAVMRARWGDALTHDPFLNRLLLPSFTLPRLSADAA